jgi:hypothetical protein
MDISRLLAGGFVGFIRNAIGITVRPYETYRRISKTNNLWELPYIGLLLAAYFANASLVKTAAFRPYLLTRQFFILGSAAAGTFILASYLFWYFARRLGGTGLYRNLVVGWAYTLIPTVVWFWTTSILYVLIPPPRTTSSAGIVFSVLFLVFSATLFFWKIVLCYLAVRFSMRLDLGKILVTTGLAGIFLVPYGILMYKAGIFKIPFI